MRRLVLIAIVAVVAAACGRQQKKPDLVAGGADVVFDISPDILRAKADTTVSIGNMRAGEIVQYNAWLRNTGTDPLVITKVDTSCGCTAVEYEKQPIKPGGKGKFSFRFDSRGQWGSQMKMIEVHTSAGPQAYQVFVRAQVENDDL